MADKSISELVAATSVGSSDLFVLEQANTAKKLTGQILENWLVSFADGHGGIQSIAKTGSTGTNPVVDTYTITLSDTTTYNITVTNGVKGDTGAQTYVWIKWAAQQPTANNQMSNNPDKWIGIYTGTSSTAPANYTSYIWYEYKGEKGETGDAVTRVARTSGTGEAGSTDVYTMYVGDPGTAIGSFTVVNGLNGTGAVNSVNGQLPDANGNVEIEIPSSVYVGPSAPTDPDIVVWFDTDDPGESIVNSVNGKSGVVSLDSTDILPAIITSGSATSGNATWTYRRWADGMVEAWGVYSASIAVTTTGYNGYRSGEISFPIPEDVGLYNSDYVIIGQKANANEITLWSLYKSSTTAAKMYFYSGASSTNTCTVHAYLMGRWKE